MNRVIPPPISPPWPPGSARCCSVSFLGIIFRSFLANATYEHLMFLYVLALPKTQISNKNRHFKLSKQIQISKCSCFWFHWDPFWCPWAPLCFPRARFWSPTELPFGTPGLPFGSPGLSFGSPRIHFGSLGFPFGAPQESQMHFQTHSFTLPRLYESTNYFDSQSASKY